MFIISNFINKTVPYILQKTLFPSYEFIGPSSDVRQTVEEGETNGSKSLRHRGAPDHIKKILPSGGRGWNMIRLTVSGFQIIYLSVYFLHQFRSFYSCGRGGSVAVLFSGCVILPGSLRRREI